MPDSNTLQNRGVSVKNITFQHHQNNEGTSCNTRIQNIFEREGINDVSDVQQRLDDGTLIDIKDVSLGTISVIRHTLHNFSHTLINSRDE